MNRFAECSDGGSDPLFTDTKSEMHTDAVRRPCRIEAPTLLPTQPQQTMKYVRCEISF